MWTQSLPSSATEYAREQRLEQRAALEAVRRQWRRMDDRFDASWAMIAPTVLAIIETAQQRVVESADRYIPAVLEETGQTRSIATTQAINTAAFIGVTGAGGAVADQLALAPIRAKQAVKGRWVEESYDPTTETYSPRTYVPGQSPSAALATAGMWLTAAVGTILSDTGRAAETTGMGIRPVNGWVRMLVPPSCGRCAVLAGRYYYRNKGFERHPGCDCRHIPATEAVAADLTVDIGAYLDSLDKAGQVKALGSQSNWRAWDEFGADPNQIINSYRRGSLRTAQDRYGQTVRYTTEGMTRRGQAATIMRGRATRLDLDAGAVDVDGKLQLVRRMPETIMRTTASREQIVRQLRLYGWTVDASDISAGRAILAEQRRIARNARRRERRAAQRPTTTGRPTPTGSGSGAGSGGRAGGGSPVDGPPYTDRWPSPPPKPSLKPSEVPEPAPSAAALEVAEAVRVEVVRKAAGLLSEVSEAATSVGGRTAREAFEFKGARSMARKIDSDAAEKGITRDRAARDMRDVVRYTIVAPHASYAKAGDNVIDWFTSRGYRVRDKPDWRTGYYGRNIQFRAPNGQWFEVQIHTEASLGAAESMHLLYEQWRHPSTPESTKKRISASLARFLRENVAIPKNVQVVG